MIVQLDLWPAEVAALPWGGQSPLVLAQLAVAEKLSKRFPQGPCGVDNSLVRCRSREAHDVCMDAAQYQLCVSTSFKKES